MFKNGEQAKSIALEAMLREKEISGWKAIYLQE
jgi:hypothetical protein